MPEEYNQNIILYYDYNDSDYCYQSPLYCIAPNDIISNIYLPPFEVFRYSIYKVGIGLIRNNITDYGDGIEEDSTLIYSYKNGISCGYFANLSSSVINPNSVIDIFPNPVNEQLNIKINKTTIIGFKVTLSNILGEIVYAIDSNEPNEKIDVSKLAAGVYVVNLTGSDGSVTNQKVIINH